MLKNATETFNRITGYESVEVRKKNVAEKDFILSRTKEEAQLAKLAYEESIESRRNCQKDLNSLLQVFYSSDK